VNPALAHASHMSPRRCGGNRAPHPKRIHTLSTSPAWFTLVCTPPPALTVPTLWSDGTGDGAGIRGYVYATVETTARVDLAIGVTTGYGFARGTRARSSGLGLPIAAACRA